MSDFIILSQDEQDDIIVNYYLAQERDFHTLTVNIQRFERMLQNVPEGVFRDRLIKLLEESKERKTEVEFILAATIPQLPSPDRLQAAKNRLLAKV